jgi:hypothetical protein
VRAIVFIDRYRSKLRRWELRLWGETFICWRVVSWSWIACTCGLTYERALVFLLLRLSLRTRFFLHLALILSALWE